MPLISAIAVLLNHGADPNTRKQTWTVLGLAAAYDYLPICLLLVARAADLYALNAVYVDLDKMRWKASAPTRLSIPLSRRNAEPAA